MRENCHLLQKEDKILTSVHILYVEIIAQECLNFNNKFDNLFLGCHYSGQYKFFYYSTEKQVHTLADATPPIVKIHPFSKIILTMNQ